MNTILREFCVNINTTQKYNIYTNTTINQIYKSHHSLPLVTETFCVPSTSSVFRNVSLHGISILGDNFKPSNLGTEINQRHLY